MNIKVTNMNLKNYNDTLYILKNLNDYQSSICYIGDCDKFINEIEKEINNKKIKYIRKNINNLDNNDIGKNNVLIIDITEKIYTIFLKKLILFLKEKQKQIIMNCKYKLDDELVKIFKENDYLISERREEL